MADCLYGLQDISHRVFDCKVLDQIGRLIRVEDQPKFCEHCPIRLNAIRFLYMPHEPHRHREE